MTTPNIDLYLPRTHIFRLNTSGKLVRPDGVDYIYLPKGLSSVLITETGMRGGRVRVMLKGSGGYIKPLTDWIDLGAAPVTRVWSGQISAAGTDYTNGGVWLTPETAGVPAAAQQSGSVSIQVINFPPN